MALATLTQAINKNLGLCPCNHQPTGDGEPWIRVWILDPLFINETRIKNIKNLQSIREKEINLITILM